jgi:phosphoglycolate phosphatase
VIFDCDGTLVDTLGGIADAMNQALALRGFPSLPTVQYRDMVGWGITRLAELALPQEARTEDNIQEVAASAQRFMGEQAAEQSRPYPGIRELLAELSRLRQAKKIAMAVLSNKPDPVLRRLMDDLFGRQMFDAVCGQSPGIAPKPDPQAVWELLADMGRNPSDTIFMGDSEIDMETARNAGCFPLGASWGFRSRATLETSGAARIIDRPEELLEII